MLLRTFVEHRLLVGHDAISATYANTAAPFQDFYRREICRDYFAFSMSIQRDVSLPGSSKKVAVSAFEQCFAEPPWAFARLRVRSRRLRPVQMLQRQCKKTSVVKSMQILFHFCHEHSERSLTIMVYGAPCLPHPPGIVDTDRVSRRAVWVGRAGRV